MSFVWPEGEFRIASSLKRNYRLAFAEIASHPALKDAVKHLADQGIVFFGQVLGRVPSIILAPDEISHVGARTLYRLLKFYGIVPESEIRTIDPRIGGYSAYPFPRVDPT